MRLPRRGRGGVAMLLLGWLLIVGFVYALFHALAGRELNPNRGPEMGAAGEVVLLRNRAGQYLVEGEINGERVTFLLDTGATHVSLSMPLARRLGLRLGPPLQLQTAAGPAVGYAVRLERVRFARFEMTDVAALVSEGLEPELVLLGMNVLKRLEMIQRGDRLILRPMPAAG